MSAVQEGAVDISTTDQESVEIWTVRWPHIGPWVLIYVFLAFALNGLRDALGAMAVDLHYWAPLDVQHKPEQIAL